jgi:porin
MSIAMNIQRISVDRVAKRMSSWHGAVVRAGAAALCTAALTGFAYCGPAVAEAPAVKDDVAPSALQPGMVYTGAAFANLGGGARAGSTYSSNLNLHLDVDASALFGWSDTIAYFDALWLQGGQPSSFIGDAQGISSISAPNSVKLYEAWVQKNFADNRLSVLAGLYDLNSEFYRLQSAGLFFNSSFGIGPELAQSGVGGPSIFPDTSMGMRIAFRPAEGMVVRTAVLNGVPVDRPDGSRRIFAKGDGALIVAEVDILDRPGLATDPGKNGLQLGRQAMLGEYARKVAIGGWYYTAAFDDLSEMQSDGQPVRHRGSGGLYVLADQVLYEDQHARKLAGFVQAGVGDYRVDRFGAYVGMGMTVAGLIPGRGDDAFGVAVAHARNGSHYMSAQHNQNLSVTSSETAVELTYLIQVAPWLVLQPDLQYVIAPNTTPALSNALAFQLRIAASF